MVKVASKRKQIAKSILLNAINTKKNCILLLMEKVVDFMKENGGVFYFQQTQENSFFSTNATFSQTMAKDSSK